MRAKESKSLKSMMRDVEEECTIKFLKYNISDGDRCYEEREADVKEKVMRTLCF